MNRETRLVVKDNALIDASFNLSLVEQRLMLLAIVEAREVNKLTPDSPIEVKATSYMEQYKIDERNAYKQLSLFLTPKERAQKYLDICQKIIEK